MSEDRTAGQRKNQWRMSLIFLCAWLAVFAFLILYLKVAYPEPSAFQYQVFRIGLALAATGIAVLLPGFLGLWASRLKMAVTVGIALAAFAGVYYMSPAGLVTRPPDERVVTYAVCLGEYERSCFPHDVYLYCYSDVAAWAKSACATTPKITKLADRDGNKCGYSLVQVICKGPRALP
jgi:hypothetical protein